MHIKDMIIIWILIELFHIHMLVSAKEKKEKAYKLPFLVQWGSFSTSPKSQSSYSLE